MPKKYLNLLLISIAFCVWMVIFYQVVFDDNDDQDYSTKADQNSAIVSNHDNLENTSQYLNKASVDPFITPFNYSTPKPMVKNPSPVKPQNIPKLKLLGILSDKNGALAIVGFPDNSVQFVRQKQIVDKFTITSITANTIHYKYEKIKQTVKME